jgi:glycosyltransferase involved in cell wall biosynthesis
VSPVNLGFFTGRQVVHEPHGLMADLGLGRVVNELHRRRPELVLAAATPTVLLDRHSERLTLSDDAVLPLPAMPSFSHGARHTLTCRRIMREMEERCDVVIVQLSFQAPLALLAPHRPRVYHVVGDVMGMARGSSRYSGPVKWRAVGYARFVDAVNAHVVRRPDARLVANGQALLQHYRARGRAVVSTSLSVNDLGSVSRQRAAPPPFRLLFAGFLRHEKGLDILLEAVTRLRPHLDVELEIVGPGDPGDLGPRVRALLDAATAGGWVRLAGERIYGPDLFQHFADADLLALPSRTEGTPRVLVEARAFGCPVVATDVGGIPTSVTDGVDGILVPPEDPVALATAIERVLTDDGLRASLAEKGQARAQEMTVEGFVSALLEEVENLE